MTSNLTAAPPFTIFALVQCRRCGSQFRSTDVMIAMGIYEDHLVSRCERWSIDYDPPSPDPVELEKAIETLSGQGDHAAD